MSSINDTLATLSRKRKRAVVSYVEIDPLVDLLSDEEDDVGKKFNENSDNESDDDDRTYSRRRRTPKKTSRKKARWSSARRMKEQKPFPFLDLPPELRDMIYEMALTDVNGISIVAKTKAYRRAVCRGPICPEGEQSYYSRHCNCIQSGADSCKEVAPKQTSLVPNILAVNKQIHHEAINVLYGQNFIFEDTAALHRFLATIGYRSQQRLLSIDIKNFCSSRYSKTVNHCAFALLASAINLKAVHIANGDWRWRTHAKSLAQGIFRDTHFFLEAYGAANGRRDAGVDILHLNEQLFDFHDYRRRFDAILKEPTLEESKTACRTELRRLLGVV